MNPSWRRRATEASDESRRMVHPMYYLIKVEAGTGWKNTSTTKISFAL